MAFLSLLSTTLQVPGGLWEWLILQVFDFIGSYGWRILVFTLILKAVLFPLDLYQRVKGRKNQKISQRINPQMEKLQQQYGGDKTLLSQKQMELNKKEGFSYFSSCLPALVTMAVFIYLLTGLNSISQYMNFKQYVELYDVYNASITRQVEEGVTDETVRIEQAQDEVYAYYYADGREGFLWIKNIWSPDVPWKAPINTYDSFKTNIGKYGTSPEKTALSQQMLEHLNSSTMYNNVMGKLIADEGNKTNGYLILPILAVGLSLMMQLVTRRQQKNSGQSTEGMAGGGAMKIMMFAMPVMMGFFALQYTAAFSIYIVVNYMISLLISLVSEVLCAVIDRRTEKEKVTVVQRYGRPDPNELIAKQADVSKKNDKKK